MGSDGEPMAYAETIDRAWAKRRWFLLRALRGLSRFVLSDTITTEERFTVICLARDRMTETEPSAKDSARRRWVLVLLHAIPAAVTVVWSMIGAVVFWGDMIGSPWMIFLVWTLIEGSFIVAKIASWLGARTIFASLHWALPIVSMFPITHTLVVMIFSHPVSPYVGWTSVVLVVGCFGIVSWSSWHSIDQLLVDPVRSLQSDMEEQLRKHLGMIQVAAWYQSNLRALHRPDATSYRFSPVSMNPSLSSSVPHDHSHRLSSLAHPEPKPEPPPELPPELPPEPKPEPPKVSGQSQDTVPNPDGEPDGAWEESVRPVVVLYRSRSNGIPLSGRSEYRNGSGGSEHRQDGSDHQQMVWYCCRQCHHRYRITFNGSSHRYAATIRWARCPQCGSTAKDKDESQVPISGEVRV